MAITNKLITFNKLTSFETQLTLGNILDTSIVFIKDAKKIWTKGTYFDCSGGGSNNIAIYETTDDVYNGVLNDNIYELSQILTNFNIYTFVIKQRIKIGTYNIFVFNRCREIDPGTNYFSCLYTNASEHILYKLSHTITNSAVTLTKQELALKSDIPNTDDFLQYLDPTLKTIAANGLLGDDEMIYALPNSSIIESEDYDKILATKDDIGYTTDFSVADIEAVYGRGITKPINVQGLISAIEANKPIIIPTNITDASNVGGNAVTMAKMENDGFIYLNVIVPYLDGVHKEYFIQIKITTAQLIKSGSNGSITLKELVAKTDLKTINGESILGSGDIVVGGEGSVPVVTLQYGTISLLQPNVITIIKNVLQNLYITDFSTSSSNHDEYTIIFSTGAVEPALPAITLPDYVLWANGSIPTLEWGTVYEFSITRDLLNIIPIGTSNSVEQSIYKAVLTPFKSV